jgi:sensor histidine kinase YesM
MYNSIYKFAGTVNVLNMISIKVVVIVLFLTSLFIFNAYSAKIVSLFQSTSVTIKNINDFANEKSVTMSIQISPYAKPYFNVSIELFHLGSIKRD